MHDNDRRERAADLVASDEFQELIRQRNRFVVPAAAFGFGAFLIVVVVSGFTTLLSSPAIGAMSGTFVATALIFPVVWAICARYQSVSRRWDALAAKVHQNGEAATPTEAPQ